MKIDAEISKFFLTYAEELKAVGVYKSEDFSKNSENLRQAYDFFGVLVGENIDAKKAQVLMIYKLIFRFSIEKLTNYLKNDMFLAILFQYLQDTKFSRIHERQVLQKNKTAYYRALENMLNLGEKQDQIIQTLRFS